MSPDPFTNQLLVGIILAILGHAITVLVKSPKEAIKDLAGEVAALRTSQVNLEKQWVRHDEIANGLSKSLAELTKRIDRLEPFVAGKPHGNRRGG